MYSALYAKNNWRDLTMQPSILKSLGIRQNRTIIMEMEETSLEFWTRSQ